MDIFDSTREALRCILAHNDGRKGATGEDAKHIDCVLSDPHRYFDSVRYVNLMPMASFFSDELFKEKEVAQNVWDCANAVSGSDDDTPPAFTLAAHVSMLSVHIMVDGSPQALAFRAGVTKGFQAGLAEGMKRVA